MRELGKSTDFAKPHNAQIKIPNSFVTPGHPNYIFTENGYDLMGGIPHIDGYPGGTVGPGSLKRFNSVAKINWLK